ncbi:helix-turn-helix transcriptional regulator [Photobacterium angustum]|uniref:LuxR C-terminal-related transcriptional regulator n=1 Tax=Photobacterium angustum TaxID=661 RepID=UPI003D12BD73
MAQTIEDYILDPIIRVDVGIVLVKNKQHQFIAANQTFMNIAGIDEIDKLIGLRDFDMPWSDDSQLYIEHEKKVMDGQRSTVIEPLNGIELFQLVTEKKPLYDKFGCVAGTIALAIVLPENISYSNLASTEKSLANQLYNGLTKMETHCLYWVIKGSKRGEVARKLNISPKTYDFHINNIKNKLEISSISQLVSECYRRGWHKLYPF